MYKCIIDGSGLHGRWDLFLRYKYSFSYYFSNFMYSWIPDLLKHWCMNCQRPGMNYSTWKYWLYCAAFLCRKILLYSLTLIRNICLCMSIIYVNERIFVQTLSFKTCALSHVHRCVPFLHEFCFLKYSLLTWKGLRTLLCAKKHKIYGKKKIKWQKGAQNWPGLTPAWND